MKLLVNVGLVVLNWQGEQFPESWTSPTVRGTGSPSIPVSTNSYREASWISIDARYAVPLGKIRYSAESAAPGETAISAIISAVQRAMTADLRRSLSGVRIVLSPYPGP